MNTHDDHKYLVALRKGDSKLLSELYSQHSQQVISWVLKNNGSIDDAKDIFQEALIALYNKACDPDFKLTYPIGGLVFQICKNKWIDQIRKKNKEAEVRILEKDRYTNDTPSVPLVEQIEEEEIRQSKLDKGFQKLSELCQKLLRSLMDGTSPKEVALQLQMTDANTVYRRKNACIERWSNLYHS